MDYQQIIDAYFEGRPPFEERNEYLGIEASTIPELFVRFFAAQSSDDQRGLAETLVRATVDDEGENPGSYASLILRLCFSGYSSFFRQDQQRLEAEAKRYIDRWLEGDNQDQAYANEKMQWHFGLKIHGILSALDSPVAGWVREQAASNAKSDWFREGLLHGVKNVSPGTS